MINNFTLTLEKVLSNIFNVASAVICRIGQCRTNSQRDIDFAEFDHGSLGFNVIRFITSMTLDKLQSLPLVELIGANVSVLTGNRQQHALPPTSESRRN